MNEETTTTPVKVERAQEPPVFRPAAEVAEDAERVRLRLDMPGVAETDLEVSLEQNELTITGRQAPGEEPDHVPVRTEYTTGIYRRVFTLADTLDPEEVHARLRHGVLEVEIRKRKEALPRKIPVRAD